MNAKQEENKWDCIIIGGGLAGGLLLQALDYFHPKARTLLLEQGAALGGNHTWCFHSSDIMSQNSEWLKRLISKTWPSYEVFFPKYHRQIDGGYSAIRAEDFHERLMASHANRIRLNQIVTSFDNYSVTLVSGEVLHGSCVIDARGWESHPVGEFGYQKFLGMDIRLKHPHGLKHVRLKDVRVPQTDGYRFIYLLPWNERELLVEDTYYSNYPAINREELKKEILNYVKDQGWEIEKVLREEEGSLPLALHVARKKKQQGLRLGASSGVYQPVTGYTFPQTLERVQALAESPHIEFTAWKNILNSFDERFYSQARYLCLLNRMMFRAADPEKRYRMLERFYTLPSELIERFYQGKLRTKDKFRILCGRPPVSIWRALKVLVNKAPSEESRTPS